MRRARALYGAALAAALTAIIATAAPAGAAADFTKDGVGAIKIAGCGTGYEICIDTSNPAGDPGASGAVWFGFRVFSAAPGTMISHTSLKTSKPAYWYGGSAPATFPCISDFQGSNANGGSGVPAQALDPGIAMIGGFVGGDTGCTDTGLSTGSKFVKFHFNLTGPLSFAFYGAFYGTEAATWRGNVATTTGNTQWWNLWGNFTSIAYSTS
ncbi:MAG: hypothetical protein ABR548_11630 [Actinomycetota bacterium]|nr:hypothetical protein [Actinomycetota bacterium]